jgi:ribosomal protein S18 acetylase RimI-like enzyme
MRLVRWKPYDLAQRIEDALSVFGEAMSYDRQALEVRRGYLATHLHRPQFQAVATLGDDDELLGFAYGYHSQAGQWWHERVREALTEDERQRWLSSCFELVELHVKPSAQGQGLGEAQLRALMAEVPDRVTLLSTPEADEQASRAWRLYRRLGFADVVRRLMFPGDPRPFAVLGHTLPLQPAA